jgi:uncharacterized protein (TIGR00661 family)
VLDALRAVPEQRFIVFDRAGGARSVDNVEVHGFDERAFVDHLESARAVICNGGYTTIAEALHLGKHVLSIPLRHQGEQELNAAYLDAHALGYAAPELTPTAIRTMLASTREPARLPAGNADAFARLDALIKEAA